MHIQYCIFYKSLGGQVVMLHYFFLVLEGRI